MFKASIVLYLSAAFAAQDSEEALPVPQLHLQSQWSEVFPPENVKLRCDVNGEDWTIIWYKDGLEIQGADTSVMVSDDSRSLTLKAEAQAQSGIYSCKGFDKTNASRSTQESNTLPITVHGEKLKPALSGSLQDIYVGESVSFSCLIDVSSSWEYVWYRNDNLMHKSSENVYTVKAAEEANNGNYHCKVQREGLFVSTESNTARLIVTNVPMPRVKLLSSWSDAIEKEQVMLRCESVGPDWTFTWFRDGEELAESPNIKFSDDGAAQLTMSSVPKSLQGLYSCRAHHKTKPVSSGQSQPIRITIHDTPTPTLSRNPPLNRMYVGETVNFTCAVLVSSGWTYKWYKEDTEISTEPTLSICLRLSDAGKYSCKALRANGAETHRSDKMKQDVDVVPVPSVKLLSLWSDVFVNETLTLGCEASSTDWSFSWFQNGQPLSRDGSLSVTEQGANLHITSASRSHMGAYSCKANHKTRTVHSESSQPLDVKVYENTPKPALSQTEPKYNPMYVGETVHFSCSVDVASGWKFRWFKDESEMDLSDSSISIHLGLSDGGKYSCRATRGGQTTTDSSDQISLMVLEKPIPQLKALTLWLDVFPSETVELGCGASSTPSDWTYEWRKDEQVMPQNSNSVSSDADGATLTIGPAALSHRGQYKCRATLKSRRVTTSFSPGLTLNVYDQKPRPILIQDPDYSILFPQEPLSLQCHINISNGWEFVWYKNNKPLHFNKENYEVISPDMTLSGSYTCEARRGKNHIFSSYLSQDKNVEIREDVPEPVLSQVPDVDTVYVGEQLTLKCSLDVSIDFDYQWYKDEQIIISNSSSIVVNATHPHSEAYRCEAKRRKTLFKTKSQQKVIVISAIPTPLVKRVTQWLDVFPGETVVLSCGMKTEPSDWLYKWSKDGQPIKSEKSVKSDRDGTFLTVVSSVSHSGEYRCMAQHKKRPVFSNYSSGIELQVYDTKPSIQLVQDPEVEVFHTDDSVFFSCGVNVSSGWEYSWYRNNHLLASGPNYTIGHLYTSHGGEYKCRAKRGQGDTVFHTDLSRSVTMNVYERPSASILLLTGWSEVFSTDSLVLKCEAEATENGDLGWEFKWYKGDEEIAESSSEKHVITPQNDPDQSEYMCEGVRSGRPSYTKRSQPLKTKNLLLKRRVLLSVSGCLVFGICAVFLGCIVLRVCRKPVVDQEKPEEADLFLTMAELAKHAPNPLAEYVTDEDIKDIAKDTDENGAICSESTLLPLTSKEDEATPSQSNSASGNGEMVSFKQ